MQVICNIGHESLLVAGNTYTVIGVTKKGNYLLSEVEVPKGHTSFSKDRFYILDEGDIDWNEDFEEAYYEEQPSDIVL
jgi:hypothetical protein